MHLLKHDKLISGRHAVLILLPFMMSTIISCDTGNSSTRNQERLSGSILNLQAPLPPGAPAMNSNRPEPVIQPIVPGSVAVPAPNAPLNPKHGQPGHRCDIPEGAPLPGVVAAPSVASAVNLATTPPPPAAPAGSAKPNPKHGEPGHRCDIPVGAPLNSPPGNVPPPSTASTVPPTNTTPSNVPKPKLNPKHGEPWHRCDIAVGASLDAPPASTPVNTVTNDATTKPADSSGGGL